MSIINYFFEKHIERCKKELENFENNKFKEVREDLKVETRKYIEKINNFFSSIDAESGTDFNGFNKKIKTFNEELNRIMKASANISTLVYVIQNVSEDDFYTYTDFISSFSYDENKFNNASERDIKYLKLLDKYLQKINDDFEVYKERVDLRAEIGLYNEAIDDYKKALELNPNYDEAKNALEEIDKKLTNIKIINGDKTNNDVKVSNTQNKESEKYYEEGVNYHKKSKWKKAVQSFDKAIELDNTKSKYYSARGRAKNGLRQYEEAKKDAYKALELDKNNAESYLVFGYINLELHQYFEVIKDYDKAIELDNNNSYAYNGRGLAKYNLGQYEEAIKDYDKAIELDPNNSYAYNNRGVSKENLGQYQEALKDYQKALELDPNNNIARENIKNMV